MTGVAVVIEDDEAIGDLVGAYLEQAGFQVVRERTGEGGLNAVEWREPRFVVLDLGLPDIDGFDVCRQLRASGRIPILILTARDEETDRIIGLELGADDYMTKPFSPRELVARVRAILRRAEPDPLESGVIELGDVRLDLGLRTVAVAGVPVALRTLEFELLARARLGLYFAGGTRTVDVHVAQLRKKLGHPELIETVRGVGYRAREDKAPREA